MLVDGFQPSLLAHLIPHTLTLLFPLKDRLWRLFPAACTFLPTQDTHHIYHIQDTRVRTHWARHAKHAGPRQHQIAAARSSCQDAESGGCLGGAPKMARNRPFVQTAVDFICQGGIIKLHKFAFYLIFPKLQVLHDEIFPELHFSAFFVHFFLFFFRVISWAIRFIISTCNGTNQSIIFKFAPHLLLVRCFLVFLIILHFSPKRQNISLFVLLCVLLERRIIVQNMHCVSEWVPHRRRGFLLFSVRSAE